MGSNRLVKTIRVAGDELAGCILDRRTTPPVFIEIDSGCISTFGERLEILGSGSAEGVDRLVIVADDHEGGRGGCEQFKETFLINARVLVFVNNYEPELLLERVRELGLTRRASVLS